ncbi:MAG: hypothetical protein IJR99_09185 [Kiritimatiellae bacterium]|nr:hypothetical protein [Kiritimatiellia bacterium]
MQSDGNEPIGKGQSNPYSENGVASCVGVMIDPDIDDTTEYLTRTLVGYSEVDLSQATGKIILRNGNRATGRLSGNYQVEVAAGAKVWLKDAVIGPENDPNNSHIWPGIKCLGDATIVLEGANSVMGFDFISGIYVKKGYTLTIQGEGSLSVGGALRSAAIGGCSSRAGVDNEDSCGNIVIEGGVINATKTQWFGEYAAAIGSSTCTSGSGYNADYPGQGCGDITIRGGTITAYGANESAAIGAGCGTSCGNIMIEPGVEKLVVQWDHLKVANPIGKGGDVSGHPSSCGTVTLNGIEDYEDEVLNNVSNGLLSNKMTRRTYYQDWDGDLSTLTRDITVRHDLVIFGSSTAEYDITIADGVTVTLDEASITKEKKAGLTCNGDVTVVLAGENAIAVTKNGTDSSDPTMPAIRVPYGSSVTIDGDGSLVAQNTYRSLAAAIGENRYATAGGGSISIVGGTVTAYGGSGSSAIGSSDYSDANAYTRVAIGPDVVKVVAAAPTGPFWNGSTYVEYTYADLIGPESGCRPVSQGGGFSIDSSLLVTDTEAELPYYDTTTTYLVRTLAHDVNASASAAIQAWAAASGASLSGAWDATDANGVPNVLRYAFDKADDDSFAGAVIIGFETDGEGAVAIQTLPVVNGKDVFTFTIVASDNVDGTGNVAEYPLAVDDPDGITIIAEEYNPNRFFRVRIDVKQ